MPTRAQLLAAVRQLLLREDGPTATEYAVMLALIIFVMLTAIASIGSHLSNLYGTFTSGW